MESVLITGATGLVGSTVLKYCLEEPMISNIVSFGRRKTGIDANKLQEVIVEDFLDLSGFEEYFDRIDIVYYCQGVYTGQVSRAEFNKITIDHVKVLVDMVKKHSPNASFCFLSGAGADSTEKSKVLFARAKGIAENYLINAEFPDTHIFRPGYIYPVQKRKEPNLMYSIMRMLYPLLKSSMKNTSITSEDLARAIFNAGFYSAPKTILENKEIKKYLLTYRKV